VNACRHPRLGEHCGSTVFRGERSVSRGVPKEEQDARLDFLLRWVREYESRDDEYSLLAHRRLYDSFPGSKHEYGRQ
jgi:hypothetical protein